MGNPQHITRTEEGHIPTSAVAGMQACGARCQGTPQLPGRKVDEFKADIAARGIQNPIFITRTTGSRQDLEAVTAGTPPWSWA